MRVNLTQRTDPYRIEPAELDDLEAMAGVIAAAFTPSPLHSLMEPDTTQWQPAFYRVLSSYWVVPQARFYKAVDTRSGKIVGAALWGALQGDELQRPQPCPAPEPPPKFSSDAGASSFLASGPFQTAIFRRLASRTGSHRQGRHPSPGELLDQRLGELFYRLHQRWLVGKPCQYLAVVGVHPDHQHRNIGERLVQVGMDEADERQVACFLESTTAGYPVYYKLGWNQVDQDLAVDLSEYGGKDNGYGVYKLKAMLRLPEKRS